MWGRRDRIVGGLTSAISAYHHLNWEARCTRYNYYVIKFVGYLRQVGAFHGTPVSSTNKPDRQNITESGVKHYNLSL